MEELVEEDVSGALAYRDRPGIVRVLDLASGGIVDVVVFTDVIKKQSSILQKSWNWNLKIVLP